MAANRALLKRARMMDGAGMEVGKYREASKSGCMCSHALL
jgi:hypothetical protein